jgi:hypothetical protein
MFDPASPSFRRSDLICTSTVRSRTMSASPPAASSNSVRLNARPGCWRNTSRSRNSVGVRCTSWSRNERTPAASVETHYSVHEYLHSFFAASPSQQCPYSLNEHLDAERFGYVIICSRPPGRQSGPLLHCGRSASEWALEWSPGPDAADDKLPHHRGRATSNPR